MPELEAVNPYVGPYAFTERDAERFFGRDREAEALLSLVIAERVTVLCSPSGAGKSSLVRARLVPDLRRRGFSVLPVARVSGEPPSGVAPDNVYVYNLLSTLSTNGLAPSETLAGFLHPSRWAAGGELPARLLVIDQLEEIVTTHADRWRDRTDFFGQLRRALLDDPTLSVLLALREDHLAALDPWAHLLPGQLRNRLRIERLRRDEALDAIRRPAQAAGRPFAPGVAEALVEDLSQLHLAGRDETVAGELVEPVQLQVVCYQLWENLRRRPGDEITALDLLDSGDIDRALESFYESAVKRAAATGAADAARIRNWCGTRLITPSRIRGQVSREESESGGLPNAAVDALVDAHLIRAEAARGGTWYELAHDRFIEPVLAANKRAAPEVVRRLGKDTRAWRDAGKDASYLYRGEQLADALAAVAELRELLPPADREFLAAAENEAAAAHRRDVRRLRVFLAVLCGALATLALLSFELFEKSQRSQSTELASLALLRAEADPELGLRLALEAVRKAPTLEAEGALHQALRLAEVRPRRSFKMAPDTASAFALSADGRRLAAVGADNQLTIWDAASDRPLALPAQHQAVVTAVAFDPQGNLLASGDVDGRIRVWTADSGRLLRSFEATPAVNALAFDSDGSRLAAATDAPEVAIWSLTAAEAPTVLAGVHRGRVWDVAFDTDGRVATAGDDGKAVVWSVDSGRPVIPALRHPKPVRRVAFGLGRLATACDDGVARLWSQRNPGAPSALFPHPKAVWDVAFHPGGSHLGTASSDGRVRIWDLSSGLEVRIIDAGAGQVRRIAFAADGAVVGAAANAPAGEVGPNNAVALLWDVAPAPTTVASGAAVLGLARGGSAVATVDREGWLHLWNLEGEALVSQRLGNPSTLGLRIAVDEDLLAVGRPSGRVDVVDLAATRAARTLPAHSGPVTAVALSARGRLLASAGQDGTARLWDLANPSRKLPLDRPDADAPRIALAFSPDGAWLAGCSEAGPIALWQTRDGSTRAPLGQAEGKSSCRVLGFSPDSRRLASGARDGTFTLWDIAGGRSVLTRQGHPGEIVELSFSPDGTLLATAGADGTVKLWSLSQGREIFALPSRRSIVDLGFLLPDGRSLAIVDTTGTVRVEPTRRSELIAQARARRPRLLTQEECRLYLRPWFQGCPQDRATGTSGEP